MNYETNNKGKGTEESWWKTDDWPNIKKLFDYIQQTQQLLVFIKDLLKRVHEQKYICSPKKLLRDTKENEEKKRVLNINEDEINR